MLFALIAIKFFEGIQMIREALGVSSYRSYLQELMGALKIEFAEINLLKGVREEVLIMHEKLEILKAGIKREVTTFKPFATKVVAKAEEITEQITANAPHTSGVVSSSLLHPQEQHKPLLQ